MAIGRTYYPATTEHGGSRHRRRKNRMRPLQLLLLKYETQLATLDRDRAKLLRVIEHLQAVVRDDPSLDDIKPLLQLGDVIHNILASNERNISITQIARQAWKSKA